MHTEYLKVYNQKAVLDVWFAIPDFPTPKFLCSRFTRTFSGQEMLTGWDRKRLGLVLNHCNWMYFNYFWTEIWHLFEFTTYFYFLCGYQRGLPKLCIYEPLSKWSILHQNLVLVTNLESLVNLFFIQLPGLDSPNREIQITWHFLDHPFPVPRLQSIYVL